VPMSRGGHSGGDARLREFLFAASPPSDPLGHTAGSRAGAMSLLVGVAANRSIATGQRVSIDDLLAAPVGAGRCAPGPTGRAVDRSAVLWQIVGPDRSWRALRGRDHAPEEPGHGRR